MGHEEITLPRTKQPGVQRAQGHLGCRADMAEHTRNNECSLGDFRVGLHPARPGTEGIPDLP